MKTAGVLLAIAAALALQTTLAQLVTRGAAAVDLVLVVVVYVALAGGPVTGLFAGTCGGLAQDALASGIIGIGGLAKTIVGFLAGVVGMQFIVARPLPRFVVFFVATVVQSFIALGLYVMLDLREFGSPYTGIVSQAAVNGLVGVLAFQATEIIPGAYERRRSGRGLHVTRRHGD